MFRNPYKVQKILGVVFTLLGLAFITACALILAFNIEVFRELDANNDYTAVCLVFGINGIVWVAIGIPFIAYSSYRKRLAARLIAAGRKISAEIEDIYPNYYVRYNRRHPYIVQCAWKNPDDGITYHFRSAPIWFNPQNILRDRQITSLPVYIDQQNIRKYHVSLEGIEDGNVFL